jgi:hypothetical protein
MKWQKKAWIQDYKDLGSVTSVFCGLEQASLSKAVSPSIKLNEYSHAPKKYILVGGRRDIMTVLP